MNVASNFKLANDFDAEILVSSLKNAGFKKLIVTAKQTANTGYADGNQWAVPEADAKISSGWFWGTGNHTPITEERLSQIYFDSVGYGATLLLSVPPHTAGSVDQAMLDRVAELGNNIHDTFGQNMAAAVLPETASNKEVAWSSSNEDVAAVDGNGLATAAAVGTAAW